MIRDSIAFRTRRPDQGGDALAIAELRLRSRRASVPAIPPTVHPEDEVRDWFATVVVPERQTWIAEHRDELVAVLVLDDGWIDQLYVDPKYTGRGLGSRLVDLAKKPSCLDLWMFQINLAARRFYERHGFAPVGATDGDNEEHSADVRYHWPGSQLSLPQTNR